MNTPRIALLALTLLALHGSGCGPADPHGNADEVPLHERGPFDAELVYDASGPSLLCVGAEESMLIPEAEDGEPYEPVAAWCSWSCARYEPAYPEYGRIVLVRERASSLVTAERLGGCE